MILTIFFCINCCNVFAGVLWLLLTTGRNAPDYVRGLCLHWSHKKAFPQTSKTSVEAHMFYLNAERQCKDSIILRQYGMYEIKKRLCNCNYVICICNALIIKRIGFGIFSEAYSFINLGCYSTSIRTPSVAIFSPS